MSTGEFNALYSECGEHSDGLSNAILEKKKLQVQFHVTETEIK